MAELWRLLLHSAATGAWNMAVDEALLDLAVQGAAPVFRLYAWRPAALSLGYFQDAAVVDFSACKQAGVDVVRRPTGGRAVLHDDEVTYAIVLPPGHPLAATGVVESYRVLSEGLVRGLLLLQVQAELAKLEREHSASETQQPHQAQKTQQTYQAQKTQQTYQAQQTHQPQQTQQPHQAQKTQQTYQAQQPHQAQRTQQPYQAQQTQQNTEPAASSPLANFGAQAACFDAPSWYELVVAGRKLVGSAQVRRNGALLQHGSIPLGLEANQLYKLLHFRSEEARERAATAFAAKAMGLRDILTQPPTYEQVASALISGMGDTMGCNMTPDSLTVSEQALALELLTKHTDERWVFHRGKKQEATAWP